MLHIQPIPALQDNYIWMLISRTSSSCLVVDPGEADHILHTLKLHQLTLEAILITHHHKDHAGGILKLLEHMNIPVYGPDEEIQGVTEVLQGGETIHFPSLGLSFEIMAIPGHTRNHIAYYGQGIVFTGDTLFTGACGRLFEGTAAQMHASLNKLAALPDETLIYCGHEYTQGALAFALHVDPNNPILISRIKETEYLRKQGIPTVPAPLFLEKQTNPFLRCHEPSIIEAAERFAGRKLLFPEEVFASIRQFKDSL